jgi:hypothetical protein
VTSDNAVVPSPSRIWVNEWPGDSIYGLAVAVNLLHNTNSSKIEKAQFGSRRCENQPTLLSNSLWPLLFFPTSSPSLRNSLFVSPNCPLATVYSRPRLWSFVYSAAITHRVCFAFVDGPSGSRMSSCTSRTGFCCELHLSFFFHASARFLLSVFPAQLLGAALTPCLVRLLLGRYANIFAQLSIGELTSPCLGRPGSCLSLHVTFPTSHSTDHATHSNRTLTPTVHMPFFLQRFSVVCAGNCNLNG